jgi:hypothetical protein
MAVSREALFEEVWSAPMTKVAARHGVSSNFLTRLCERLTRLTRAGPARTSCVSR